MCKPNWIAIGFKWKPVNTNLSLSITGADSFVEGANTQYTASLVLSWVIGSPDTVLTVTLPAWITYVSSSDSGSESGWVITWTLGNLMANKNVTFTITSSTPAPVYELTGIVTSDFGNLGTTTASKDIEVEETGWSVEVRVSAPDNTWTTGFAGWDNTNWPTSVTLLRRDSSWMPPSWWTSLLTWFTFNPVYISGTTWRVWYVTLSDLSNGNLEIAWASDVWNWWKLQTSYDWSSSPITITLDTSLSWCTDPEAANYNPYVYQDDWTCDY